MFCWHQFAYWCTWKTFSVVLIGCEKWLFFVFDCKRGALILSNRNHIPNPSFSMFVFDCDYICLVSVSVFCSFCLIFFHTQLFALGIWASHTRLQWWHLIRFWFHIVLPSCKTLKKNITMQVVIRKVFGWCRDPGNGHLSCLFRNAKCGQSRTRLRWWQANANISLSLCLSFFPFFFGSFDSARWLLFLFSSTVVSQMPNHIFDVERPIVKIKYKIKR